MNFYLPLNLCDGIQVKLKIAGYKVVNGYFGPVGFLDHFGRGPTGYF